ncbi:Heme-degrading monooxygenase HmoA [Pseudomonas sp. NFACC19-2]|uniref:Antibiotic biosynthesis monooxygenase n=1 Tax=Ectopseudomonas toyotomiensis TaxID=554344 RepID=A0AA42IHK1_9GAMM|nr:MULTISPECIES: antibiotic biosynthesis monooxygenase [Pseudomonas]MBG0838953.1 antibiotic biosynthesis monooxygenase [Pseudomonas toyotomiensis]MDH0699971.1 antibiotic biosynthesis monooxygenase [Pseudomonas toyotomiensis]SFW42731.1 Heme-degrading monooxygenase HmoA [Pseudomonas sp. NFACC19-2]
MIATTPEPPYYVVIFTSVRTEVDAGYAKAAQHMLELAAQQPGFLGVESARSDGLGITLSYWQSEEAIRTWREHAEHSAVREQGRADWYAAFTTRVAKVERAYTFSRRAE